ncbi:hypothetical protein AAMO2058_000686700 [Amorphochlora amoebiformis]
MWIFLFLAVQNGIFIVKATAPTTCSPSRSPTQTFSLSPTATLRWNFLDSGDSKTCALGISGNVKCWGKGLAGALGYGSVNSVGSSSGQMGDNLPPVDLGPGVSAVQISVDSVHTCVVTNRHEVKCWGGNPQGQLGLGDTVARGDHAFEMSLDLPSVDLGQGKYAKKVVTGRFHTCALLTDGTMKCWGLNRKGELGQGHTKTIGASSSSMGDNLPSINLGANFNVTDLCAGRVFTCAVSTNGNVKCFGRNAYGILGIGTSINMGGSKDTIGEFLPYSSLGSGVVAKSIECGDSFVCVLLGSGDVKCWGNNAYGQLGLGHTGSMGHSTKTIGDNLPFVDVGGKVRQISVGGGNHVCVLLYNGQVKCWGYNTYGQLGMGDTKNRGHAVKTMGDLLPVVDLGSGMTAVKISAGYDHTCALRIDGCLVCWGYGNDGSLGIGNTNTVGDQSGEMGNNLTCVDLGASFDVSSSPTSFTPTRSPIITTSPTLNREVAQLVSGFFHTCALGRSGWVKCWGQNSYGQLGQGHNSNIGSTASTMGNNLPPVVFTGDQPERVYANEHSTCAISFNGTLSCWGSGAGGKIGIGNTDAQTSATLVPLPNGELAEQVASGESHACVLTTVRNVYCWGSNSFGQLGYGDTTSREYSSVLSPVNLGTGFNVTSIVAGQNHNCVLLSTGGVKCWGEASYGSLGLGSTINQGSLSGQMGDSLPVVDLGTNLKALKIYTGFRTVCAILDDNSVKCWGDNSQSQLGMGSKSSTIGTSSPDMGDNLPPIDLGSHGYSVEELSITKFHVCALFSNAQVKCWGRNVFGQLGYGDRTRRGQSKTQMGDYLPFVNVSGVIGITTGAEHTCIYRSDDCIMCWGGQNINSLGTGKKDVGNAGGEIPAELSCTSLGINFFETLSPSSCVPSISPTSQCPSSLSPSSLNPSSLSPKSSQPSCNPTTSPTTSCPTSAPATLIPSTCNPSSSSPSTFSPSTVSPIIFKPPSLTPTSRTPSTDHPVTSEPASKSPASLSPSSCSPSTRSPSWAPSSFAPSTCTPSTCHPTSGHPTSINPSTWSPTTVYPTSSHPTSMIPSFSPSSLSPTSRAPTALKIVANSAKLDDTLISLTIEFSFEVQPKSSDCTDVFSTQTIQSLLGTGSTCQAFGRQIQILLGYGSTIQSGSTIDLLIGAVISLSGALPVPSTTLTVESPSHPINPTVVITGPNSAVTFCETFELSSSASTGSGGRTFTYAWSLASSAGIVSTEVEDTLNEATTLVTLSSDSFSAGSYVFKLTLTNWAGGSSSKMITVVKVASLQPTVTLPTLSGYVSVKRTVGMSMAAQIGPPSCNSTGSLSSSAEFYNTGQWTQLYPTSSTDGLILPGPIAGLTDFKATILSNSSKLEIPADDLEIGEIYGFKLTAWSRDSDLKLVGVKYVVIYVVVQSEPIIANLKGGDEVQVIVGLATDGSSRFRVIDAATYSEDPANKSRPLTFNWSLDKVSYYGGLPFYTVLPIPEGSYYSSLGVLNLNTTSLSSNATYRITVAVIGEMINNTVRMASDSQLISTTQDEIPLLGVSVFGNAEGPGTSSNPVNLDKMDTNEKTVLSLEIQNFNETDVEIEWICLSHSLDLSNELTTKTGGSSVSLVISPNVLSQGQTYVFQASAVTHITSSRGNHSRLQATSLAKGIAKVTFSTNLAPRLGTCTSSPKSGGALSTNFRLSCDDWEDTDIPLQYDFQVFQAGTYNSLSGFQERNYYWSLLPGKVRGTNISLCAVIKDTFGAKTYSIFFVSVEQRKLNLDSVGNAIDSLISGGDFNVASVYLFSSASYLRSETSSSVSLSKKSNVIDRMVGQVGDVSKSISTSSNKPATVTAVSGLCNAITDFQHPNELRPSSRERANKLITSVLADHGSSFTTAGISGALGCMANVLDSASESDSLRSESVLISNLAKTNGTMVDLERQRLRLQIENNTNRLASELLKSSVLNEAATEINLKRVNFLAAKYSSDKVAGSQITSSSGIIFNLPDIQETDDSDVEAVVTLKKTNPYPLNGVSGNLSGALTVKLQRTGAKEIKVKGVEPFEFEFPPESPPKLEKNQYTVYKCLFFNETLNKWSTEGLNISSARSENRGVVCKSSHLTAFSTEVQININDFSAEDIKTEAFLLSQPIMVHCLSLAVVYIIAGIFACIYDNRKKIEGGIKSTNDFWFTKNYIQHLGIKGDRHMDSFRSRIRWKYKNNNAWVSVVYRHPGDFMNSFKRLTVLFTLIYVTTGISALLDGQDQKIFGLQSVLANPLVAFLFGIPIPVILAVLFGRKKPHDFVFAFTLAQGGGECLIILVTVLLILVGEEISFSKENEESNELDGDDVLNDEDNGGNENEFANIEAEMAEHEGHGEDKKRSAGQDAGNIIAAGGDANVSVAGASGMVGVAVMGRSGLQSERKKRAIDWETIPLPSCRGPHTYKEWKLQYKKDLQPEGKYVDSVKKDKEKPRNLCCGIKSGENVSNHDYTVIDVLAITFCIIVILGCWFVIVMLGFVAGRESSMSVLVSWISLFTDAISRCLTIIVIEIFLFFPCVCCVVLCDIPKDQTEEQKRIDHIPHSTYEFQAGMIGFQFLNRCVVNVEEGSQAKDEGVLIGGMILKINGVIVTTDEQIYNEIQKWHRISPWFKMTIGLISMKECKNVLSGSKSHRFRLNIGNKPSGISSIDNQGPAHAIFPKCNSKEGRHHVVTTENLRASDGGFLNPEMNTPENENFPRSSSNASYNQGTEVRLTGSGRQVGNSTNPIANVSVRKGKRPVSLGRSRTINRFFSAPSASHGPSHIEPSHRPISPGQTRCGLFAYRAALDESMPTLTSTPNQDPNIQPSVFDTAGSHEIELISTQIHTAAPAAHGDSTKDSHPPRYQYESSTDHRFSQRNTSIVESRMPRNQSGGWKSMPKGMSEVSIFDTPVEDQTVETVVPMFDDVKISDINK